MKILIIEDDKLLSESIAKGLKDDFKCEHAYDGEEGLYLAQSGVYDGIILDIMLPELNGYEVLERLRNSKINTPVLLLTARDSIDDKINGFKKGADDYLVKPFYLEELKMRIFSLLKRNGAFEENEMLSFKDLKLNLKTHEVTIRDEKLIIKGKNYELLEYLMNNKGAILTKDQIFDRLCGFDSDTAVNVVEVYASNLRKILKDYDYDKYIKTMRGFGYMLVEV